ncbi:MAG: 16S rRNA (cytidine(1402)-2'-O)-methyltransferase [Candidatus Binatia bacterium]|nr:16S rRNA (cytidine(1402)-2'-O)-methyltransferase [Candidatus Binatia bacterium]
MAVGTIYVVATPIGNLEDITRRAERILGEVDVVAAEDTRRTRVLLQHLGLSKPLVSYYDAIEATRAPELIERALAGESIALVSDAGTPLLSDPGFRLVGEAHAAGVRVIPIPGPSAPLALLSCAGLPAGRFTFLGFLPAKTQARRKFAAEYSDHRDTLVLFETARRLPAALQDLAEVLGPRDAVIGRELTKKFEELVRGTLEELAARYAGADDAERVRGELVLAIAGAPDPRTEVGGVDDPIVGERLRARFAEGESASRAARAVALELGLPRRDVYRRAIEESETD